MVVVMASTDLVPGPPLNPQDSVQWQKLRNNQDCEIFTPESNNSSVYVASMSATWYTTYPVHLTNSNCAVLLIKISIAVYSDFSLG